MMRWTRDNGTTGEYDVLVDGVTRAEKKPFGKGVFQDENTEEAARGGGVSGIGLYVIGEGHAWLDEIYLGPDFTMGKRWVSLQPFRRSLVPRPYKSRKRTSGADGASYTVMCPRSMARLTRHPA